MAAFVSRRIPLLAKAVALTYGAFAVFEEIFGTFQGDISVHDLSICPRRAVLTTTTRQGTS
jgi:hypothetical protein